MFPLVSKNFCKHQWHYCSNLWKNVEVSLMSLRSAEALSALGKARWIELSNTRANGGIRPCACVQASRSRSRSPDSAHLRIRTGRGKRGESPWVLWYPPQICCGRKYSSARAGWHSSNFPGRPSRRVTRPGRGGGESTVRTESAFPGRMDEKRQLENVLSDHSEAFHLKKHLSPDEGGS